MRRTKVIEGKEYEVIEGDSTVEYLFADDGVYEHHILDDGREWLFKYPPIEVITGIFKKYVVDNPDSDFSKLEQRVYDLEWKVERLENPNQLNEMED